MERRIPDAELRRLRNDIHIDAVLAYLRIPCKIRDGYNRFVCPRCHDAHTFTNADTNLACCMTCRRTFNGKVLGFAALGRSSGRVDQGVSSAA